MQTMLFKLGLVLFMAGLLTGFAVPALKNPRMALSNHLEAVLNGMFLLLLGLLWPHVDLPHAWGVAAIALIVYAAYANWLASLLAAMWVPVANLRRSRQATMRPRWPRRASSASCWCHRRSRWSSAWSP